MIDHYSLELVTSNPELWEQDDPVRPELSAAFKTAHGREVYGLKDHESYIAFCCIARTLDMPKTVEELDSLTSPAGTILVPYTVWSMRRGAGRMIIKKIVDLVSTMGLANRIITLSPPTVMARKFHIRNGALEVSINPQTVNFEYIVPQKS